MKKYKKNTETIEQTKVNNENEEDKLDPNSIEIVVDRVEHGLIGSLRILDDINKPIFQEGDIVNFREPSRILVGDFLLYKSHDEYFVRRVIKFVEYDIYVAGDNEREYRIVHKEDVIGKAVARERNSKYLSLALKPGKKFYNFLKVKLAALRLGDRVLDYEGEINNEALEQAMLNLSKEQENAQQTYKYNIDLDSELDSFLNPDTLVLELRGENEPQEEEYEEYEEYEDDEDEIEYVDEDGNPISPDEIEYVESEDEDEYEEDYEASNDDEDSSEDDKK